MSKTTHFVTVTPLPAGITRETVLCTLHNHFEMIDLNPLVTERHPIKPPSIASPEEFHCKWYSVTDKVKYLPGGLYTGSVTFSACFHDLPDGLQTHIYAPMGLDMKGRWTLGGTLPGEPVQPVELGYGVPKQGLWLREDVTMKCNVVMTKFVKGTTKKAHGSLVQRLVEKAHLAEADKYNENLNEQISLRNEYPPDYHNTTMSSPRMGDTRTSGCGSASQGPYSPPQSDTQSLRSSVAGSYRPHSQVDYSNAPNDMMSGGPGSSTGCPQDKKTPPPPASQHPLDHGFPEDQKIQPLNIPPRDCTTLQPPPSSYNLVSSNFQAPNHLTAELPSGDVHSPVEMDSQPRYPPYQTPRSR